MSAAAVLPEKIGKYKIQSLLAKGGMGAVYLAVHPELKRNVIIKKLSIRGNKPVTERFKREARILMEMNNNHIVHMYDYFVEKTSHYIVIEYVEGMSVDKFLAKTGYFSAQITALIMMEICTALKYGHDRKVVHRDVKPGNILISNKGEIKLTDFGIAYAEPEDGAEPEVSDAGMTTILAPASADTDLTTAGSTLGTPSYMPPEQFLDAKNVDLRADIYAAGVTMYELLTGQKPFQPVTSPEILKKVRKRRIVSPRRFNKTVPRGICRMIRKMLRYDPKRRYQTFAPVIAKLRRYLNRHDVHDIRVVMVRLLRGIIAKEPKHQARKNRPFRIMVLLLAFLAGAAGICAAWSQGVFHATVLRGVYAPVHVEMKLPATVKTAGDLQFRVFFFEDDNDKIPELENCTRIMMPDEGRPELLHIRPVYLKPGAYRLKMVAGPRIWWQSFVLTLDGVALKPDFGTAAQRPLNVYPAATDSVSGAVIENAVFTVQDFATGKWVPLQDIDPEFLKTGTVRKFRISADGYETSLFSLKIDWFQDELFLTAALKKRP